MKKVRVCFEVQRLAIDANGNPAPAGMQFTIGEVPDEKYEAAMESVKAVKAMDILHYLGFDSFASKYKESDFRLIFPEEYDREYGDDQSDEAAQDEEGGK